MSFLYDYQMDAVKRMRDGCILNGTVGSGKSRTALFYYFKENGGWIDEDIHNLMVNPLDLYIITTARKRDTLEWESELVPFLMYPKDDSGPYHNKITIDSWNNIKKYVEVKDAFFIFDEDRVVGNGAWVKAFLKIVKSNRWILLSATPGDTWSDYIPVFIANGFYKNATQFKREHVIYKPYVKYPVIDRYVNTGRLIRLRRRILVDMDFKRKTIPHHVDIPCEYDKEQYKRVAARWNVFTNEPIVNASEYCQCLRKIVNTDWSRMEAVIKIVEEKKRVIIFYNYDYELDILKAYDYGEGIEVAEWNGHKHQPIPESNKWVYLVQYNAGSEGWNCVKTDTIIFFSQNYSYRMMAQAAGRIDRLNTPYEDLYFYHLKSKAWIDISIDRALKQKKKFNETKFFER